MADISYTHSINENPGADLMLQLIKTVEGIDTEGGGFNLKLQTALQEEFGAILKDAHPVPIDDLYPYKVEMLMTLFQTPDAKWCGCMFLPYTEEDLTIYDESIPRGYMIEEITAKLAQYLNNAKIDNFFIIGYE
jgi:hypothetical protein